MRPRASTLAEARRVLDPRPLAFGREMGSEAEDPAFYEELPPVMGDGRRLPGPIEAVADRLLNGGPDTKMFLSGHVGSGKSTELARLAIQRDIAERFTVAMLRFEEQEWATLDSSQVLFRMAGEIVKRAAAAERLSRTGRWQEILGDINARLLGEQKRGISAKDSNLKAEVNLFFVKVTQELKLSEGMRQRFRELGETLKSTLGDLLREVADDYEEQLARHGEPASLLLIVDDLDKVRGPDNQRDIFETNLNSLLALPFRAVYTVPSGVAFGANRADLRQNKEHLYPIRVLHKVAENDPERAWLADRYGFFLHLVHKRVEPALVEEEAVRLAALYSGGVLRDFFRLLREGIKIAQFNGLDILDALTMRAAIKNEKLRESAGLYAPDFSGLAEIHRRHQLRSDADRHYLDESRVIECFNDQNWFEVAPLLWSLLPVASDERSGE